MRWKVEILDIYNTYLNTKTWAGPEFGNNKGKICIIVRALYGVTSSGAVHCNNSIQTVRDLSSESCPANADIWRHPVIKIDGSKYYEYILTYVGDYLITMRCGCGLHTVRGNINKLCPLYD